MSEHGAIINAPRVSNQQMQSSGIDPGRLILREYKISHEWTADRSSDITLLSNEWFRLVPLLDWKQLTYERLMKAPLSSLAMRSSN